MKKILVIVAIGGLCFLAGLFFGARARPTTEAEVEAVDALNQAGVLLVDVRIAEDLHDGRVNDALNSIILRIDANMVSLADRKKGVLYEVNTLPALNFALAYRKTNSWMNGFGFTAYKTNDPSGIFSKNIIADELQKLLSKP